MSSSSQQQQEKPQLAGRNSYSPRAGCLLMMIIFVGFCVLVVVAWWQVFNSTKAVSAMCQPQPQQLPLTPPDAAAKALLQQKIATFEQHLGAKEGAEVLQLAPSELNMLIAEAPAVCGLQNSLYIQSIENGVFKAQLAMQLKAAPFSPQPFQYWNGSADLRPKYVAGRFKLFVENAKSNTGAQVPEGFLSMLNPWEPWSADEQLNKNPLWDKISAVECRDGYVLVSSSSQQLAQLQQHQEQQPISNTLRYVIIIGLGLLVFAVLGWLYQRRNKRMLQG